METKTKKKKKNTTRWKNLRLHHFVPQFNFMGQIINGEEKVLGIYKVTTRHKKNGYKKCRDFHYPHYPNLSDSKTPQ